MYNVIVLKKYSFFIVFFCLTFLWKKNYFKFRIKRIKLNFKNLFSKRKFSFGKFKKLSYDALSKEKNIEIIYKDLNPKSMILSFLLVLPAAKITFQNLNKLIENGKMFSKHID